MTASAEPSASPRRHRRGLSRIAAAALLFVAVPGALGGCAAELPATRAAGHGLDIRLLRRVRSWAIQLQGLELPGAGDRLARAHADLLVIDAVRSVRGMGDFPIGELVRRLNRAPGPEVAQRRCIAYLNVGQAEDYRSYWQDGWRPRIGERAGHPAFLLGSDPDGWAGNYQVAFWDPAWRRILFGADDALLDQVLADGFDGVYLDWILAYRDPEVVAAARRGGLDPARAMVELLRDLRAYARARSPFFVVIAQNGVELGDAQPELFEVIDGFAHEDLSFSGKASATWDDAGAGDIPAPADGPWSTPALAERLRAFAERGIPVFTLDYAREPEHVRQALERSRACGFVPCVSRTPLDRLPEHALVESEGVTPRTTPPPSRRATPR